MRLKIRTIPWYLSWKGLIGEKPKTICLKTRFGIHTFFMSYPIDVVILNGKNRVKKLKSGLKPNRIFFWNPLFDTVLELPNGTIKKMGLKQGQALTLQAF